MRAHVPYRALPLPAALALASSGLALAAPTIDLDAWDAPSGDDAWSATRLIGLEVRGADGESVGEVEDVVVGDDDRVAALVLELGGPLDVGDAHVRVPWEGVDSVDAVGSLQYVALPLADDELAGLDASTADAALEPGEWRAADLVGDAVRLVDSAPDERGTVDDLLFGADGALEAVVASGVPGTDGAAAPYPFFGADYGFEPALDTYTLPYGTDDLGDRAAASGDAVPAPVEEALDDVVEDVAGDGPVVPASNVAADGVLAPDAADEVEDAAGDGAAAVREPVTIVTEPVEVATLERPDGGSGTSGPDGGPDGGTDGGPDGGTDASRGAPVSATLDAEALFGFDSAELKLGTEQALADLLVALEDVPDIRRIEVVGHTDDVGPEAYNLDLSRERAQAVADFLATDYPDVEIVATGVGEAEPQAPNDTPEGRQLNRRVDVTAYPG